MIDGMRAEFGVEYLCAKFTVSVSGYYAWKKRPISAREAASCALNAKVLGVFIASHRAAGHRKVAAALQHEGISVNRKTVLKSMRHLALMPPAAEAAFRRRASGSPPVADPEDLVERRFDVIEPGTVLVGDITYVRTGEGWLYTATVIDLATRTVLGSASGKRQTTQLVITAMRRAIATGIVKPGAIFHSDHGTQYRSKQFANFCGRHGIRRSMGKNFECWDNAVAESFFSKLKNERLRWRTFPTRAAAAREIADYIRYFNTQRRHQYLGYATPAEALARHTSRATDTATTPVAA